QCGEGTVRAVARRTGQRGAFHCVECRETCGPKNISYSIFGYSASVITVIMRVPELIIEEQECSETYQDQRPGTSGLRKRVETFSNGTYLHNFVQAIIDCIPDDPGSRQKPIIVSGDGRYFNKEASQIIIAMLAANG
ncbi:hypothetical protein BVRB_022000, partial [Beta vulgaris subsp. vulgaris]